MPPKPYARIPTRISGRTFAASLASGMLLLATAPSASAQIFRDVPWDAPEENGISVRAQVDVMFQTEGGGQMVLMTNAFQTGAAGQNLSSEYIFETLNRAALEGLDEALQKGAKTGRVNVVAVCYAFGVEGDSLHSLAPMGVFINTTDMDVLPDGKAAFRTNVKFIPPAGVAAPPIEGNSGDTFGN